MKTKQGSKPIRNPKSPPAFISPPLPANTTESEDRTLAGQRKVNLIWEYTQAFLALFVTTSVVILGIYLSAKGQADQLAPFLTLILGIIIGSYFQRTNHMNIGSTGAKTTDKEPYVGR